MIHSILIICMWPLRCIHKQDMTILLLYSNENSIKKCQSAITAEILILNEKNSLEELHN